MDRRVGVLRVPQDVEGKPDALKRRVDVVLGRALHDRLVDFLHATIEGHVVLGARERRFVRLAFLSILCGVVLVHVALALDLDLSEDGGVGP